MKTLPQIIQDINNLKNSVNGATNMLHQGQVMELEPVESRVQETCKSIAALNDNDRAAVRPHLLGLLDDMDKFYELLKTQHSELKEQIKKMNPQRQATQAYSKAAKIKPGDV